MMDKQWIVVRSKPRSEKVAHNELVKKNIEAYLPLLKERRKWSDRKKWVEFPLFSSYLFARIDIKDSIFVLQTRGVNTIVKFGKQIAIVQGKRTEGTAKDHHAKPEEPATEEGRPVVVVVAVFAFACFVVWQRRLWRWRLAFPRLAWESRGDS